MSASPRAARTLSGVVPAASEASAASWMTGPSITGSEKGIPTSTASAPAATTASRVASQSGVIPAIR